MANPTPDTFVGTNGSETIIDVDLNHTLLGLGGDDIISAIGGSFNNVIDGGASIHSRMPHARGSERLRVRNDESVPVRLAAHAGGGFERLRARSVAVQQNHQRRRVIPIVRSGNVKDVLPVLATHAQVVHLRARREHAQRRAARKPG